MRPDEILQASSGILAAHQISALLAAGVVKSPLPTATAQVQPASLDLRLGARAWRMRASFLPGPDRAVAACIPALNLHEIDLTRDVVLETGCVYLAEISESLALPDWLAASTNPKSSTGRIDVFTRVIVDGARAFDQLEAGYRGPILATSATRDLCGVMLPDAGGIQEGEVQHLNRRNQQRGRPTVEPIFTKRDGVRVVEQFRYPLGARRWVARTSEPRVGQARSAPPPSLRSAPAEKYRPFDLISITRSSGVSR